MSLSMRLAGRSGAVLSFAVLLVLLAMMTAAVVVASRPAELPSPFGLARNGLIAYDALGDIWVMQPDGSDRRQLTSGPSIDIGPLWSPDGTRIAYGSWPNTTTIDPTGSNFEAQLRVWLPNAGTLMVMNADGSDPRQVGRSVGTGAASWAPDSGRLAYADGDRWFIDALDGSDDAELVVPTKAPDSAPAWSPDGGFIAYKGGSAADGTLGVWVAEADGSGARQVSAPVGAGQDVSTPVWSPDGASVAFFVGPASGGAFDVHIASLDGTGEIAVTTAGPDEYWPAWSPDGSRLVFDRVTVPSNNLVQLVVAGPDGSDPLLLESEPLFPTTPVWAPDGTAVAMQLPDDPNVESAWGTASDLVLLDPTSTTGPRLLPVPGAFGGHSWQRLAP